MDDKKGEEEGSKTKRSLSSIRKKKKKENGSDSDKPEEETSPIFAQTMTQRDDKITRFGFISFLLYFFYHEIIKGEDGKTEIKQE